ncbi:sensor histidine kinase [Thomasclavelia saccharogumia]|uniref:sensor histidine kinase n=1 Tax=Thomasclavelia saccharogumia TaxID=341225 RepID=UPI00047EA3B0|nr:sensor histidine kinase [Thomasclavelia saccharogumia]
MKKYNKKISFSKLLFSFSIILVLLSLEILYAVIIKNYRSTLEETASDMSWAVTGTITTQLSYYTNEIYNILSEINQTIATTGLNEGWKLIEEQNNIREDLLTVWFCNEDGNYWKIENGAVVTYNDTDMLSIDLSRLSTAAKNHLCIGSTNGSYNINFPFKTDWSYQDKTIYMILECNNSYIRNLVESIGRGKYRYSYVVDSWGELLYTSKETIQSELETYNDWAIKQPDGISKKNENWYHIFSNNESSFKTITVTNLKMTVATPLKQITLYFLFVLILLLVVIASISWIISWLFSRPVTKLAKNIEKFNVNDDLKLLNFDPMYISELDTLQDAFIDMAKQNQEFVKQMNEDHEILRKTELNVLQEQINPHFLYNTLTSIQWLCKTGKNEEAAKMTATLGKFYRIGLSRGKELITIREELLHASSYMSMQEYRFSGQFDWQIIAQEDVMDYLCCRIIIQPFLENAIYHGMESEIEKGKIIVRVTKEDALYIWVEDNGIGMTKDKCESILKNDNKNNNHVGIRNVNDRIQICFGKEYGVTIISEVDKGTKIKIRLPLKKDDNI